MFQHLLMTTLATLTSGQQYNINFNPLNPYIDDIGKRSLQPQQPECTESGDRLICTVSRNATEEASAWTTLTARLDCALSPLAQNDFRSAKDCQCEGSVLMTKLGDPPVLDYRDCTCMLCPAGFGDFPFSINCDTPNQEGNPVILDECTSIDCGNNCNGTCVSGCEENVAPECESLCENTKPSALDPDGSPPETSTPSGCTVSGDRLLCSIAQNISEAWVDGPMSWTTLQASLDCAASPQAQENIRQAKDCKCDASVVEFSKGGDLGDSQMCSCMLCPAGLGDQPISVDCSNNLELANDTDTLLGEDCAGLDCDGICIGEFLTDLVKSQKDLSAFEDLILASRISAFWRDRTIGDKFTVFAPTNLAFDKSEYLKLYGKYMAEAPDWVIHLTVLLKFHTVEGLIKSADFTDGQVLFPFSDESSETFTVSLPAEGGVDLILGGNINKASVVGAELITGNGVVHKVNHLFTPKVLTVSLMESITQYPVGLSKFRKAIVTVGLEDILKNDDVTVFAPTDDAFGAIQGDLLTDAGQQDELESLLLNHIIEGVWHRIKETRSLTSLAGLRLRIDDTFQRVNGVHIELSDRVARNGILHIIQGLLVPPDTNSLRGLMATQEDLSTFASVVSVNNTGFKLGEADGPFTLFAPTNAAVLENSLSKELVLRYLSVPGWKIHRRALFLFHTYHGLLFSANLTNGQPLTPLFENLRGETIRVSLDTDEIMLSGEKFSSNLIETDLQADNGVLHKVDQLFLPKQLAYNLRELFLEIDGRLAIFEQLVVIVGLEDSLSTQFVTLFGPINNALEELGWDPEVIDIINTGNEEKVRTLLLNHVVENIYHKEMLTPGLQLMSLAGHTLTITNDRQDLLVNGVVVDVFNKISSNGIAHVIDGAMYPSHKPDVSLEPITENPTNISSSSPSDEQGNATSSPTVEPTQSTEGPPPTSRLRLPQKFRLRRLRMKLKNAGLLKTQQDIEAWEKATETLYLRFYNSNRRRLEDDERRREARDVTTDITFESQEITIDASGQTVNTITYDQSFEYTLAETDSTEDLIPENLVTEPFADEAARESYEQELEATVPAFEGSDIGATSAPVIPADEAGSSGDGQSNTILFIGMACMAVAAIVACFFTRRLIQMNQRQLENTPRSKNLYGESYYGDEDEESNDAFFMRDPVARDVQAPGTTIILEHKVEQDLQNHEDYSSEEESEEGNDIVVTPPDFLDSREQNDGGSEMNQTNGTHQVNDDHDNDKDEDESKESSEEIDDVFDTFLDER